MGITIEIQECEDPDELILVLERIIELLKQGYASGYEPEWSITETPQ